MSRRRGCLRTVCAALATILLAPHATSQEPAPRAMAPPGAGSALLRALPDDVVAVAWVDDPVGAVEGLGAAATPVPPGLPPEVVLRIGAGLVALRLGLRGSIPEAARTFAAGGLAVGLGADRARGRLFVASRPHDPDAAIAALRRAGPHLHAVVADGVLLLSDAAQGLDAMRAASARDAATPAKWSAAAATVAGQEGAIVRAWIDLAAVRRLAPELAERFEPRDGVGRVLLLPVAHALAHASTLAIDLRADAAGVVVEARADASPLRGERAALLARGSARRALPALGDDGLLCVSFDRSLRALFADLERYLPPDGVAAAQGFLSIADALDGARTSFVDDLLGGLVEPFAAYVTSPADEPGDGDGPVALPGLAIAADIADPRVEPVLTRFAQVFATIANTERLQRGKGAFQLRRVDEEGGRGFVAEPPPWRGPGAPPIDRQLAPTLLCGAGIAVLATTPAAARSVLARASQRDLVQGDIVELRGPAIADAIARNRAPLLFARMLDEGEDEGEALRILQAVEAVAASLRRVALACEVDEGSTCVRLRLERLR